MPSRFFCVVLYALALQLAGGMPIAYGQAPRPAAKTEKAAKADSKIDSKTAEIDAAYKVAQTAFDKRDFDGAIKAFDKVIRLDPKYVEAHASRGMAWSEKAEFDKALKDFNEALKIDPKFAPALLHRGVAWTAKGEYDNAIKDFGALLAIEPKDDAALFNRGLAWSKKGDVDKALKDFNASIKLDDTFLPAFVARGDAWSAKKDYDKALRDYDEALKLDPKEAAALNAKAWLLATCPVQKYRDGKTAVDLATKACKATEFKEPDLLDTLSCACAEAGRFDEAVKWQKQALADPEFAKESSRAKLKLFEAKKPFRDEGK